MTDDQAWAFRALARHAARLGRSFVMLAICVLAYAIVACGMLACSFIAGDTRDDDGAGADAGQGSDGVRHPDANTPPDAPWPTTAVPGAELDQKSVDSVISVAAAVQP